MRTAATVTAVALLFSGCTTSQTNFYKNPQAAGSTSLCRTLWESTDLKYRQDVAAELISRGITTAEECQRRVKTQNAAIAGIAIAATAAAVVIAANNGGFGGGNYSGGSYGVAWDQFYNQYYQPIWRCRDKSNGQFVADWQCSGKPMHDGTWPGWSG
jgi:hypothetical protein